MSNKQLGPPTPALQKALQKAQACCNNNLNAIEWYEELAKAAPEIDPAVVELRLKHEHLDRLSRVGLRQVSVQASQENRE